MDNNLHVKILFFLCFTSTAFGVVPEESVRSTCPNGASARALPSPLCALRRGSDFSLAESTPVPSAFSSRASLPPVEGLELRVPPPLALEAAAVPTNLSNALANPSKLLSRRARLRRLSVSFPPPLVMPERSEAELRAYPPMPPTPRTRTPKAARSLVRALQWSHTEEGVAIACS